MTHQREAVELLPCPFCGSDDVRFEPTYIDNDNWGCIVCKACSAEADYGSRKDATSFWNTRAKQPTEVTEAMKRAGAFAAAAYGHPNLYHPNGEMLEEIYLAMRSQQSGNSPLLTPEEEDELVARINGNPNLHPKEQP